MDPLAKISEILGSGPRLLVSAPVQDRWKSAEVLRQSERATTLKKRELQMHGTPPSRSESCKFGVIVQRANWKCLSETRFLVLSVPAKRSVNSPCSTTVSELHQFEVSFLLNVTVAPELRHIGIYMYES